MRIVKTAKTGQELVDTIGYTHDAAEIHAAGSLINALVSSGLVSSNPDLLDMNATALAPTDFTLVAVSIYQANRTGAIYTPALKYREAL